MPPKPSSQETSIIVALMEQINGLRNDLKTNTETITKKLDEQSTEARQEFKELREEVADVKARLAEGSEKMRGMRRDIDQVRGTTALERKPSQASTAIIAKTPKLAWWKIAALTAVITYIAPIAFQKIIDAMATKPVVATNHMNP